MTICRIFVKKRSNQSKNSLCSVTFCRLCYSVDRKYRCIL